MKILSACLALFFTVLISFATQDPAAALLLQSGIIYPTQNVQQFINEPIDASEVTDGFYYRIIQFSEYPDLQLQAEIAAAGIKLNNYLPYRSYNCAIPVSFDRTKCTALKIFSVLNWEGEFKLSRKINGQDFPAHTIIEKGHADVIIHYQQNLSHEHVQQFLTSADLRIMSSNSDAQTFTIRLKFERLNELV